MAKKKKPKPDPKIDPETGEPWVCDEYLIPRMGGDPNVRDYAEGESVAVKQREGHLFDGTVAGVYPRGLTVYRNGVERTKPHFCKFGEVWRVGCVDLSDEGNPHGEEETDGSDATPTSGDKSSK